MSRKAALILIVLLLSVTALAVYAGNVHWVGDASTSGGSFVVEGDVGGLMADHQYTFTLNVTGTINIMCQNKGGKLAPGQNPKTFTATTSATQYMNGSTEAHVYLRAEDPSVANLTAKEAGCPNNNWTVIQPDDGDTVWTGGQLQVVDNTTGAVELVTNWTCSGVPETCVEQ